MEHFQTEDDLALDFTHSINAEKGLREHANNLVEEDDISEIDALRISAMTMDGAGEGETVESPQTCRNLFKEPVKGLTTDDIPEARKDKYAKTEVIRHRQARRGVDLASIWMTLSRIPGDGKEVANKIADAVDLDENRLSEFQKLIYVTAVKEKWSDTKIVEFLKAKFENETTQSTEVS